MSLMIKGSEQSPVINPVFLVHDWDKNGITIKVNGTDLIENEEYRWDEIRKINGKDLIIWIDKQLHSKSDIVLE